MNEVQNQIEQMAEALAHALGVCVGIVMTIEGIRSMNMDVPAVLLVLEQPARKAVELGSKLPK